LGTPGTPQFIDAPVQLNTTVYSGRLVLCSSTAGSPTACRAFYLRFDGSGQYCTVEPADFDTYGYPAFYHSGVINNHISYDTMWDTSQALAALVFNYYKPSGDAISTFYGLYNRPSQNNGLTGPAMLCFLHFGRTCRPECFVPPSSLP
jgi:hypothetical protein